MGVVYERTVWPDFSDDDKELLTTNPPTKQSLARASFLGAQLRGAAESEGAPAREITGRMIEDGVFGEGDWLNNGNYMAFLGSVSEKSS